MCGLVGMAGNPSPGDLLALKWLLFLDALRGEDSTGLAVVEEKDNNIGLYKSVGGPHCLFYEWKVFSSVHPKNTYAGPKGKVFIGHNRAATRGEVTEENAHPFLHGKILGAHNGTLQDHCITRLDDFKAFDVDSEAVIFNFDKHNIKDTISKLEGAWAFTVYDKEQDKMFFIRNSQRPLHYTRRVNNDVIYWSSDPNILTMALTWAKVPHTEIKEFEINTLYSLDVSKTGTEFKKVNIEVEDKDVCGHVYKYMGGKNNWDNPFPYEHDYEGYSGKSNNYSQSSGYNPKSREDVMEKMVGKTIEFKFGILKKSIQNMDYLSVYATDYTQAWDFRVHHNGHHKAKEWVDNMFNTVYQGKIKRFVKLNINGKKESYLTIDLRSIKKVPEKLPTKEISKSNLMYKGFNGRWLNDVEWMENTFKGCAWCSVSVDIDDAHSILFIEEKEFVCHECKKDEEVIKYISKYNGE